MALVSKLHAKCEILKHLAELTRAVDYCLVPINQEDINHSAVTVKALEGLRMRCVNGVIE